MSGAMAPFALPIGASRGYLGSEFYCFGSAMKTSARLQSGFSLVEILLVIGIIGALMIGAFIVYPKVQLSRQVNEMVERSTIISASTQQFFGDRSYAGLTTATALSAGILEPSQTISPWGAVELNATSSGNGFRLDFTGLPRDACQKMVAALEPNASSMRIGTTFVKFDGTPPVAFNILTGPASCTEGATLSIWPIIS
jgi:prepilin-type N-terminal cleavage/methylation domain-containing protein